MNGNTGLKADTKLEEIAKRMVEFKIYDTEEEALQGIVSARLRALKRRDLYPPEDECEMLNDAYLLSNEFGIEAMDIFFIAWKVAGKDAVKARIREDLEDEN